MDLKDTIKNKIAALEETIKREQDGINTLTNIDAVAAQLRAFKWTLKQLEKETVVLAFQAKIERIKSKLFQLNANYDTSLVCNNARDAADTWQQIQMLVWVLEVLEKT